MAIDRTADFLAHVRRLEASGQVQPQHHASASSHQHSQFNAQAAEIGREIDRVQLKLTEFQKMVKKSKSHFNDRSADLDRMTASINQDIVQVNAMIQQCEATMHSSGNRQAMTHYNNLLSTFRNRAFQLTREFKEHLEMRTKSLQQQDNRRAQLYSNVDFSNVGMGGQSAGGGFDDLESMEGGGSMGSGQAMGQAYASSRADAVKGVQKVIGELGSMFQNMAQMVTQQEEMLMRIDQYWNNISSNRSLIIKVFAILIAFMIFFIMFIA